MRRKSERTSTRKSKPSPEKKVEKPKRTRSRRKKNSTSSENESADDASPAEQEIKVLEVKEEVAPEVAVKEDTPEEAQDQVWQVKASEGSGDVGEIQKLKICLTRPPSTPERPDRSPRSKRKHSRATSSSDLSSVEGSEEKRKNKHKSKRSLRESKDGSELNQDSQEEETDAEAKPNQEQLTVEVSQSGSEENIDTSDNAISTSDVGQTEEKANVDSSENVSQEDSNITKEEKASDADTTVVSPPEAETPSTTLITMEPSTTNIEEKEDCNGETQTLEPESPTRRRSASVDKSEILELHPEDSKCDSDGEVDKSKAGGIKLLKPQDEQVSKNDIDHLKEEKKLDINQSTNKSGVVESQNSENTRTKLTELRTEQDVEKVQDKSTNEESKKSLEHTDSLPSNHEEPIHNGQSTFTVSRKRRWGSRPAKVTTQMAITISSDVLKDIIPDVKPVEFEEVIEEKKHKREREVTEKVERPLLPKIVIDNTDNAERDCRLDKKDQDANDKDVVKPRDLATNRKISIIKDADSIIARPPSPPRHKPSSVLYITNLVRPFTLPQLKNLLQRTGRIMENGFWIDKIKSKCFVIYENEDQAVETRHALHGVTWPVSNPKTLQVDFSTQEDFDNAKKNEDSDNAQVSVIPGTVEDWLREQDMKRERGDFEKPWERKSTREWDLGKNEKEKEKERLRRDDKTLLDKRRHRTPERSPEPARKFKKKEEEAPAKLLDDLFKKTKTTPCIYWLPLSAETIAIKEEQRRQHMAEHERRMQEQRRHPHRRH